MKSEYPLARKELVLAGITVSLGCAIMARILWGTGMIAGDDAFMTFRVMKNLMAGEGLVYNPGERVSGTTALFSLFMAPLCLLFDTEPVEIFRVVNFTFSAINLLLFYVIIRLSSGSRFIASAATLLFSLSWFTNVSSAIGMETPLYLFTILAATACQLHPKLRLMSGIFCGLCFLARPEGVFLTFAIAFYRLWQDGKIPWKELLASLAIALPWLIFSHYYYGSIIPHSALAKKVAYGRNPGLASASMAEQFFDLFGFPRLGGKIRMLGQVFMLLTVFLGSMRAIRSGSLLVVFLVFNLALYIFYGVSNPLMFEWYVPPLELAYYPLCLWGLWYGLSCLPASYQSLLSIGVAAVLGLSSVFQYQDGVSCDCKFLTIALGDRYQRGQILRPWIDTKGREELYLDIALRYRDQMTSETTVLAPEFGVIGYYLPGKMLSVLGHINPEVLELYPIDPDEVEQSHNSVIPLRFIKSLRPDYLITLKCALDKFVIESDWYAAHYETLESLPTKLFGCREIVVVRKRTLDEQE